MDIWPPKAPSFTGALGQSSAVVDGRCVSSRGDQVEWVSPIALLGESAGTAVGSWLPHGWALTSEELAWARPEHGMRMFCWGGLSGWRGALLLARGATTDGWRGCGRVRMEGTPSTPPQPQLLLRMSLQR